MSSMLYTTLLIAAEGLTNPLLRRDQVTLERLAEIQGQVIAFELTQPAFSFYLIPTQDGLQLQAEYADTADTTFSGSAADFFTLLTSHNRRDALFGNSIHISGNSELAQQFQTILDDARIDWEALLGDLIGDLPAHNLSQLLRWKANHLRHSSQSLLLNLQEYLQEEAKLLPTQVEAKILADDIDALQERVERLSARVANVLAR
ncbi:ubiquinone biosynthesis accessory factor UbiJ [Pontibacter sp. JAM-7]|uniref:ubiquinone biosynthesis accessory factor UbiJ n=1 Tax=Pontibacter sp. JAM-7 TaxID=3366581 RepID=UPI003AF710A8